MKLRYLFTVIACCIALGVFAAPSLLYQPPFGSRLLGLALLIGLPVLVPLVAWVGGVIAEEDGFEVGRTEGRRLAYGNALSFFGDEPIDTGTPIFIVWKDLKTGATETRPAEPLREALLFIDSALTPSA